MALNIRNAIVERLIGEIVAMTGESKTEAVRRALEERRQRLAFHVVASTRAQRLKALLETEIWPQVPAPERGRRLRKEEEEELLGFGGEGV